MSAAVSSALPLVLCALWAGCTAAGLELPSSRLRGRLPLVSDHFVAPAAVLRVKWSRQLVLTVPMLSYKPQEFAAAAVSDDGKLVYIGSSEKTFYALRPRDGEVVWERDLSGAIASEPLYLPAGVVGPEPLVLFGDDDGALNALEARSGQVRWTYHARGPVHVQPSVHGGLVYFTSGEGRIYALDAKTGAWRWQYERETPEGFAIRGHSGALPVGNRVYVGFADGYLACLNGESGEVIWTRQLAGDVTRFTDVDSTPVVVGDTLYVSCYATGVYALDVKDGSTRWRFELEVAGPIVVAADGARIYAVSAGQGLFCLDHKGRKLWQQSLSQLGELAQPTLWGPYLLLSAAAAGFYVADAHSGELLQYFDPGQGASARPIAHGHDVYLLSNAGAFFGMTTQ